MDHAVMVASLVEFYDATAVRAFWKQALDALTNRTTVNIHINATGQEGRSASGIELSTPEQQNAFIRACMAAVKQLEEDTSIDPAELGVGVDFSHRAVRT